MMVLLHDLKNFLKEISITEIKHLDPVRVRIYIQGLIDSEERRMTDYKTGVMPSLVKELNDLLDLVNDIEADRDEWKVKYNDSTGKLQRDDLFDIAKGISNIRDKIVLYTEYKKVKVLKEQVDYLKEKLSITEVELEKLSERKLNAS
jgi:hypothetical protein